MKAEKTRKALQIMIMATDMPIPDFEAKKVDEELAELERLSEKQIPYKLTKPDEDTGICICGRVTEIIDGEYYCKYCGQKVTK